MESRKGWILTRHLDLTPDPVATDTRQVETLAVVIPSRKVTNKVVDDLVREAHRKEFNDLWPHVPVWHVAGEILVLRVDARVSYRLTPVKIFG